MRINQRCAPVVALPSGCGITGEDVSFGPTALSSSYQLVGNLLPPLHCGATVNVMGKWAQTTGFDALEATGATLFVANPTLLAELLVESRTRGQRPASLRCGLSGGAPMPPTLKAALRDELGLPLAVAGRTWFPRDVEEALCAQPGVKEAAVIALPDPALGQRPLGYVTLDDATVDLVKLKRVIATLVPYDLAPLTLAALPAFPTTPTGKAELRERAQADA